MWKWLTVVACVITTGAAWEYADRMILDRDR